MKSVYKLPVIVAVFCATFLFVTLAVGTTSALIGLMSGYGLIATFKSAVIFPPTILFGLIVALYQVIANGQEIAE
jgi:hypothetical protein